MPPLHPSSVPLPGIAAATTVAARRFLHARGRRSAALLHQPEAGLGGAVAMLDRVGAGLCAPYLRPLASSLLGVDLSDNMLAQARATGLYDDLACADIGAFLAARPQAFDLAVAADVLVYFGDLDALFAQVRGALRPGGWFCFSTEAGADAADCGYVLQPSNRYAHSLAYLRRLAPAHGFALVEAQAAVVRSENGSEVAGHLLVLRAA